MLDLLPTQTLMPAQATTVATVPTDCTLAAVAERLRECARDMEAIGLPWAADHVRKVAGMAAAEWILTAAFRT